jgi:hypothetical protein
MLDLDGKIARERQQLHGSEGNKYAADAIKTLLLLNGGAAVALLTFVGNWKASPTPSISGPICAAHSR